MTKKLKVGISIIFFLTVFSAVYFTFYVNSLKNLKEPAPLSENQKLELNALLDSRFKERTKLVHQLPYPVIPANLSISAFSIFILYFSTFPLSKLYMLYRHTDCTLPLYILSASEVLCHQNIAECIYSPAFLPALDANLLIRYSYINPKTS